MNTHTGRSMWVTSHTELNKNLHGNFINLVSHEMKTPVTSIKGYVQLLLMMLDERKDIKLPEEFKSSLLRIDKQVWQLTRLITEMIELSRIEAGKFEMYDEIFSINQLVEESIDSLCLTNPRQHINIIDDVDYSVRADKSRIHQVILNFLTNAIKYSANKDEIIVHISKNKDDVSVSVLDHGIGIDKEEQKKIFEPNYYEHHGAVEQTYPGFGIGLYIAKTIIEKYNGSISVQSEPGKGSIFTFSLPIVSSKKINNGKAFTDIDS